jgi:hypothetical protein
MTYNYKIYIWEQSSSLPEPATFEAAGQTMRALQATNAPANAKFVALVEQLLKRHPSQASDPGCLHSAWGGDPLKDAQNDDETLFCLSLPTANRVELLRLVVDSATALGLAVFDDQIGMAFFPSGAVLPEDRAPSWVLIKAQMDSENL